MYSKPYIPILVIVCSNNSMKNMIKRVKAVKTVNVKINESRYKQCGVE